MKAFTIATVVLLTAACGAEHLHASSPNAVAARQPRADGATADSAPARVGAERVVELAAGDDHTCARTSYGRVRCWGANGFGQLGDGTSVDRAIAVSVEGLDRVTRVRAGGYHSCALREDATVRCWGSDVASGAPARTPVILPALRDVVDFAVGQGHVCAILRDRGVTCVSFGRNAAVTRREGVSSAVAIYAGPYGRGCAVSSDRSASCWGSALGSADEAEQVRLDLTDVRELTLGHSECASRSDGSVWCWRGRLDGTAEFVDVPERIPELSGARSLAGSTLVCGIDADGDVRCQGTFDAPRGSASVPRTPSDVGVSEAVQVAVGKDHACALREDGSIACWGSNALGQLGTGEASWSLQPVAVVGIENARALSVAADRSCVILSDGSGRCWGYGHAGALGNRDWHTQSSPVPIEVMDGMVELATSADHTCARRADGSVHCWGDGRASEGRSDPVLDRATRIAAVRSPLALSSGTLTVGALGRDGRVQLISDVRNFAIRHLPLTGLVDFDAGSAAGGDYGCGLRNDGTVVCAGSSLQNRYGELGVGRVLTDREADELPPVVDLGPAVDVAAGHARACAVQRDGLVRCWGAGFRAPQGRYRIHHQMPPGEMSPRLVEDLDEATRVSVYSAHACALRRDASVWCWGANHRGQLGDGTRDDRPTLARRVDGIEGAVAVEVGEAHSCALLSSGAVRCWGDDTEGQLGRGGTIVAQRAVVVRWE